MTIVIIESGLIKWKRREPLHIDLCNVIFGAKHEEKISSKTFKIANTDSGYLSTENGLRIELYAGTTGKLLIKIS